MNGKAFQVIQQRLESNERLLWSGRPRGGFRFNSQRIFLLAFTALWIALCIGGLVQSYNESGWFSSDMAGFGFGLFIGVVILPILFVVNDLMSRWRLFYGIAARRVIIVHGVVSWKTPSFALCAFNEIEVNDRWDGTGRITVFADGPLLRAAGPNSRAKRRKGFRMIGDVNHVHLLLIEAKARACPINAEPRRAIVDPPLPRRRRSSARDAPAVR